MVRVPLFLRPLHCCSATLRIVGDPGESFNGVATVTFGAKDVASVSSSSSLSSSSTLENDVGRERKDSEQTFDVEFYFCPAGNVWHSDTDVDSAAQCSLCTDVIQGALEVTRELAGFDLPLVK